LRGADIKEQIAVAADSGDQLVQQLRIGHVIRDVRVAGKSPRSFVDRKAVFPLVFQQFAWIESVGTSVVSSVLAAVTASPSIVHHL